MIIEGVRVRICGPSCKGRMIIEGVRVRICGPSCTTCNLMEAQEQPERGKKELTPEEGRKILEGIRRKINEARKTLEEREKEKVSERERRLSPLPYVTENDEERIAEGEMDDNVTTKNDKEEIKYLVLRDSEDEPLYLIEHSGTLPEAVLIGSTFYTYWDSHHNPLKDMRAEHHYKSIEVLEYPQFRAYS